MKLKHKKESKLQKGITLIALVITIIVLLILAGVSIAMLTGDNGILTKAQTAKEETQKASEDEQKTLSKYEYELAKSQGEISETETVGEYSMEKEIKAKYGQDIKIGDIVNYEDSVENYNGTWKVLGVENGQILLMSSKSVTNNFALKGRDGFLNLENKLDEECKKYGKGEGAESARSLRAEDINRISGYDPEESIYGKDTLQEYGTKVRFTLDNGLVKYECSNGQSLKTELTSFEHVDGRKLGDDITEITIINRGYTYKWTPEESIVDGKDISLHTPLSDGIKNLFPSDGGKWVWLANSYCVPNLNPNR